MGEEGINIEIWASAFSAKLSVLEAELSQMLQDQLPSIGSIAERVPFPIQEVGALLCSAPKEGFNEGTSFVIRACDLLEIRTFKEWISHQIQETSDAPSELSALMRSFFSSMEGRQNLYEFWEKDAIVAISYQSKYKLECEQARLPVFVNEVRDLSVFHPDLRARIRYVRAVRKNCFEKMQLIEKMSKVWREKGKEAFDALVVLDEKISMINGKLLEIEGKESLRMEKLMVREGKERKKQQEKEKKQLEKEMKQKEREEKDADRRQKEEEKRKEKEKEKLAFKKQQSVFENFFTIIPKSSPIKVRPLSSLFVPWESPEYITISPFTRPYHQNDSSKEISQLQHVSKRSNGSQKCKFISIHTEYRPAYFGTISRCIQRSMGRHPFRRIPSLEYSVDSDEEWSDEEEGEDLSGEDLSDDEEENIVPLRGDGLLDDGWLMPEDPSERLFKSNTIGKSQQPHIIGPFTFDTETLLESYCKNPIFSSLSVKTDPSDIEMFKSFQVLKVHRKQVEQTPSKRKVPPAPAPTPIKQTKLVLNPNAPISYQNSQ